MAIHCEFINVIIPIANIDRVYPGGFSAYKRENETMFGRRLWHDDHLFRDGAMSLADAEDLVLFWHKHGLEPIETKHDGPAWKDLCVVEHFFNGPTLSCDWIVFDREHACVYLKGTPSVPIIGREHFRKDTSV